MALSVAPLLRCCTAGRIAALLLPVLVLAPWATSPLGWTAATAREAGHLHSEQGASRARARGLQADTAPPAAVPGTTPPKAPARGPRPRIYMYDFMHTERFNNWWVGGRMGVWCVRRRLSGVRACGWVQGCKRGWSGAAGAVQVLCIYCPTLA